MKMPTSSVPIMVQSSGVPLLTRVAMEVTMEMSTASAEVPAARYMGSCEMLVRKGTSRKPPPTPRNAAMAEMTMPPTMGRMGLNENSTPEKVNTHLVRLVEMTCTPMAFSSTCSPLLIFFTASSKALAASLAFFLEAWPAGEVSQNRYTPSTSTNRPK